MVSDGVSAVQFRLLGPVEVWVGGRRVDAGPPRQRAVLAALLVDAGRVVPVDTLIDRVWGEAVREQARATLQVHLSRIRRLLQPASEGASPAAQLSRASGGYVLAVDPDQIDLHRFRRLAATGAAGCGVDSPVKPLREALALWQGPPMAGVDGEWADRMRVLWDREHVDAAVAWARVELAQANPRPVLASLAELANDHPLVESLTEVQMLALHAAGRTSEALDLYARTRALLAEELGTDPGPDLQALHAALLRGEVQNTPSQPSPLVPRQLPAPPQLFTGRIMELADLDKIHDASTVVITAIDGMAGVGKTALAVQAAHRMVDRYPDGQLFVDLHGYTEAVAPMKPSQALDCLLRSLGVPGERIPADVDQRAALYRSRLAEQRMVIVLDNAATETQVTPLLPGAPGCVVLVTSRRRLAGLDHTHTMTVDTLPVPDAVALLHQTTGDTRLVGEPPDVVEELVELCGRLPLAIRIAAARLRSHPTWGLGHLAARLRDQQQRLAELSAGERSVTAALDLSYQDLSADQQRTYRRLGLHIGSDVDAYAAAALLDATVLDASQQLERLLEAHLLQEPTPGRYRFHDLTRAHAAYTATRDEPGHYKATHRLLDYYRYGAAVAMDTAYPFERDYRPQVPPASTPAPDLADSAAALNWLNRELPNLLAAARYATDHDEPAHLLHLSSILHWHLRTQGAYQEAETLYQQALTAARAADNSAAEAEALAGLGHTYRLQGQHTEATDHYMHALRLARTAGHHEAEMDALVGLGHMDLLHGRYELGADHYQKASQLARTTGHHAAEMKALNGLGHIRRAQGRHGQATDHYQQALQIARATGYQSAEMEALNGLGILHWLNGRYDQATVHLGQALRLAHTAGHLAAQMNALAGLGLVHRFRSQYDQAAHHFQHLLDLAAQSGNRNYQFEAWQGLGRIHCATGHLDTALTHHHKALTLATELDQPGDQARAHDGLAHAHHALHQPEQARTHWQCALDILTRIGVDHTEDEEATVAIIRAHLERHEIRPETTPRT
jgi:DNA-binding SARP family transcriptional activator/tetratricopeptide (TPR) repeat protein